MALPSCFKQTATDCGAQGLPACSEARTTGASDFHWTLLARKTEGGKTFEVWREDSAHPPRIWSDALEQRYLPDCFNQECERFPFMPFYQWNQRMTLNQLACGPQSKDLARALAGLSTDGFRLPSPADFAEAERHGIRAVLPNWGDRLFWTSENLPGGVPTVATLFLAETGTLGAGIREWRHNVRCVSGGL